MNKMTSNQLRNLSHGEKVYRFLSGKFRKLYFVGIMPKYDNSYIFCDGDYLTQLYISPKDNSISSGEWYNGEYNSDFAGKKLIEYHESKIDSVQRIYLTQNNN